MKKVIKLFVVIMVIFSFTMTAFAADFNDEIYTINGTKMRLIEDMHGHEHDNKYTHDDTYGLKAVYEVINEEEGIGLLRAIPCDYCSTGSIITTTIIEEWGPKMVSCPAGGYGSDYLVEYKYYSVNKCNSCGHQYSKVYTKSVWKIGCDNTGQWDTIWYTIGSGTNIHCTINPKTWQ